MHSLLVIQTKQYQTQPKHTNN